MTDTRIEKFVITNAFCDTNIACVRGEFVDGAFRFDGGEVGAHNVFETKHAAIVELIRRAKELLAALGG